MLWINAHSGGTIVAEAPIGTMMNKRAKQNAQAAPALIRNRIYLRAREYADLTGTPIASVYKYISDGQIPSERIGGTVRIPVAALAENSPSWRSK